MAAGEREWGKAVQGCRLSVSVPTAPVAVGAPVEITIVFRNDGDAPALLAESSKWTACTLTVKRGLWRAELTEFGERVTTAKALSASAWTVEPGQERALTLPLDQLYDLSEPGTYTVRAARTFPSPTGEGAVTVASNRAAFEVHR